jgi:hypothetical protein
MVHIALLNGTIYSAVGDCASKSVHTILKGEVQKRADSMQTSRTQCMGKKRHCTRRAAELAAEGYFIRFHQQMHVYSCEYCRTFHIGHHRVKRRASLDWTAIEDDLSRGNKTFHDICSRTARDPADRARWNMLERKFQ